eukprot:gene13283-15613_t
MSFLDQKNHGTRRRSSRFNIIYNLLNSEMVEGYQAGFLIVILILQCLGFYGLYYANRDFNYEDYVEYIKMTSSLSFEKPGFRNTYWIKHVSKGDREDFETTYNLTITQWDYEKREMTPSEDKEDYFPLLYHFPTHKHYKRFVGFDIGQSPMLRETLKLSVETTSVCMDFTDPWIAEYHNISVDIVLVVPIFKTSIPSPDYLERKDDLVGFSLAVFSPKAMLSDLRKEVDNEMDFQVFLAMDNGRLFYQDNGFNFMKIDEVEDSDVFKRRTKFKSSLAIADKSFTFLAYSTKYFEDQSRSSSPIMIATIFCILTFSLSMCVLEQQKRRNYIDKCMKEKSQLLDKILPQDISHKLEHGEEFSSINTPEQVIQVLMNIFYLIDEVASKYEVEKIKTIGDAYMAATGVSPGSKNLKENVRQMLAFSLEVLESIDLRLSHHLGLKVRIGIHCGPVISGVISGYSKPHYDVWGDTVNVASRMESTGTPGRIHVSDRVVSLSDDQFEFSKRGNVYVKGKGNMMTYYLIDKKSSDSVVNKNLQRLRRDDSTESPTYADVSPRFHVENDSGIEEEDEEDNNDKLKDNTSTLNAKSAFNYMTNVRRSSLTTTTTTTNEQIDPYIDEIFSAVENSPKQPRQLSPSEQIYLDPIFDPTDDIASMHSCDNSPVVIKGDPDEGDLYTDSYNSNQVD